MPSKVTSQMQHKGQGCTALECAPGRLLLGHISVKRMLIFSRALDILTLDVKKFARSIADGCASFVQMGETTEFATEHRDLIVWGKV